MGTLHFVETFSRSCILHKLLKSLHSGETFLHFVETMICILAKLFAICRNYVLHSVETFMLFVETVLHFGETLSNDSFHISTHENLKVEVGRYKKRVVSHFTRPFSHSREMGHFLVSLFARRVKRDTNSLFAPKVPFSHKIVEIGEILS